MATRTSKPPKTDATITVTENTDSLMFCDIVSPPSFRKSDNNEKPIDETRTKSGVGGRLAELKRGCEKINEAAGVRVWVREHVFIGAPEPHTGATASSPEICSQHMVANVAHSAYKSKLSK
jgi:hypothetical protein